MTLLANVNLIQIYQFLECILFLLPMLNTIQHNISRSVEIGTTNLFQLVFKRFFPSEFGNDADRVHAVEPSKTMYENKAKIRRIVEAEGIPYTYVVNNFFASYFLKNLSQPGATAPPREKVVILGDGNPKGT